MKINKMKSQLSIWLLASIMIVGISFSGCTPKDSTPKTPDNANEGNSTIPNSDNEKDLEEGSNGTDDNIPTSNPEENNFNMDDEIIDGTFKGYINGIDTTTKTISFDDIEWIPSTNTERLGEIGVEPDTVLEYYIYNPLEENINYNYGDTLTIELLDETTTSIRTLDELGEVLRNNKIFCEITIAKSTIVQITELYLP